MALTQAGMSQRDLAKLLYVSDTEMSIMMKHELAVREQNEIVKRIREHDAQRRGIHHERDNAV